MDSQRLPAMQSQRLTALDSEPLTAPENQRFNLTHGDIAGKLLQVSLPIIGTQLMLMGYNLVDMFLLGRVGSGAVAASGSAGMYLWLSNGLMFIGRMGSEIGVAQHYGRGDRPGALAYSQNSLFLSLLLGLLFGGACVFAPHALIAFLNIQEADVAAEASGYLFIVGFGAPAVFLASSIAGTFTGAGNSRTPFFINLFGLALNALLDPIFIFTLGMGVRGAALATIIAQILATCLSVFWLLTKKDRPFVRYALAFRPDWRRVRRILAWSVPVAVESMLFTFFAMIVTRHVALWGAEALTVARVGSQIESLCWLVCQGFASGITAFVGQNFGAGKWRRIRTGLRLSLIILCAWGVLVTILFLVAGGSITWLFVPEDRIVDMGERYLAILAFCEVFFCLESVAAGAFRGVGRTLPPSIASITANALRIPVVYWLSATSLDLDGVWLGVCLTASLRGVWVYLWFVRDLRTRPVDDLNQVG